MREARKILRDAVPSSVESVDRENVGYGLGEGYAGPIFTLTPYKDHVNLGVYDGARLPTRPTCFRARGNATCT